MAELFAGNAAEVIGGVDAAAAAEMTLQGLSFATGQTKKAIISIRDDRDYEKVELKVREMEKLKSSNQALGGLGDVAALAEKVQGAVDAAVDAATAAAKAAGMKISTGGYTRSIEVQFNPSSIQLSGFAGDEDVSISEFSQGGNGGIRSGSVGAQVELNVKLIFDHTSNTAAFQQDLLNLMNANTLMSAAGSKLKDAVMGRARESVQISVEAFIAALRNDKTRAVCFEWGDMKYEGMLRQVYSNYTMFDMNGNPIRAEVTLNLYLVESTESVLKDYSNGYWFAAYKDAFIKGNPVAELALKSAAMEAD